MSSASDEFVTHCLELLGALGPARARRMFGGHGVYVGDHFLALIIGETLYLKADDEAREAFRAAGSAPFEYATRDRQRTVMAYWAAPQDAMESPALMLPWARLASALRAAASKRPAAARRSAATPRKPASATPVAGRSAKRRAGS
jgi:DNA transformation protein